MLLEGSCHCGAVTFSLKSETPVPFMRCYCSICRKTAGGGGCYAINIMGLADTLKIEGGENLSVYRAVLGKAGEPGHISRGQRNFCSRCGSPLWMFDPHWPDWVYPVTSAIDTTLPTPAEEVHMMEEYRPAWCNPANPPKVAHFNEYPQESIADWHRDRGLSVPAD